MSVKEQAIKTSLRGINHDFEVDDIISGRKTATPPAGPGGMPGAY